jgi:hypothetical protein
MDKLDYTVFVNLYRDAYEKCFSTPYIQPIIEAESKLFQNDILEHTGLTVGWRSLKNYSSFIIDQAKDENPSVATLDTLARYVLKAPYSNEISRKKEESHHPYWFLYRERYLKANKSEITTQKNKRKWLLSATIALSSFLLIALSLFLILHRTKNSISFVDKFENVRDEALVARGWKVLNKDSTFWKKRGQKESGLTLFTLMGDNWPDKSFKPTIKNLLTRELPDGCFIAEIQMTHFMPCAEWQQAGILLSGDSSTRGPFVRLSLSFNDLFGGYKRPKEVIVQGISSTEAGGSPEEFVHTPVLLLDSIAKIPSLVNNLTYSSLQIEKQGKHYRFLFAGGANANAAFKQFFEKDLTFEPRYISLFALKGNMSSTPVVPVIIKEFSLKSIACE